MYRNWGGGEPNNYRCEETGGEYCAAADESGLWSDVSCLFKLRCVCQDTPQNISEHPDMVALEALHSPIRCLQTGKEACEGRELTFAECTAISCCSYDDAMEQCRSAVGGLPCTSGPLEATSFPGCAKAVKLSPFAHSPRIWPTVLTPRILAAHYVSHPVQAGVDASWVADGNVMGRCDPVRT